jgi:hypothetical protein
MVSKQEKEEIIKCSQCLMTNETTGFKKLFIGCSFCYNCKQQLRIRNKTLYDLNNIIVKVKKKATKKSKYDAILGISGGYDSTSACYWSKILGLNLLLVHIDNGFNKKITDDNIKAIVNWSEYDIIYPKVNLKAFSRFYLDMISSGVINLEHLTDCVITSTLLKIAKKEKIPTFISGSNVNTESFRVSSWGSPNTDKKNLRGIAKHFGRKSTNDFKSLNLLNDRQTRQIMWNKQVVYPLNYVNYNPFQMAKRLCKNIPNYKKYGEKHEESILTDWYQWYWLYKKYDIDKRIIFYSNNILAGHMTREEALEKLSTPPKEKPEQIIYLTKKFGFKHSVLFEEFLLKIKPVPYQKYGTDKISRTIRSYYYALRRKIRRFLHGY